MIEIENPLQHWREYEIPGSEEFVIPEKLKKGGTISGVTVAEFGPGFTNNLLPLVEKNIQPIKGNLHRIRRESIATSSLYYELGDVGSANIHVVHFFNFLKIAGNSGRYLAYLRKNNLLYADWQEIEGGWFIEYFSALSTIYSGPLILSRVDK